MVYYSITHIDRTCGPHTTSCGATPGNGVEETPTEQNHPTDGRHVKNRQHSRYEEAIYRAAFPQCGRTPVAAWVARGYAEARAARSD